MEELTHEAKGEARSRDWPSVRSQLGELVKRFKATGQGRKARTSLRITYNKCGAPSLPFFRLRENQQTAAIVDRRQYGYPHDWGKRRDICSMGFRNMGDDSDYGVAVTRDPAQPDEKVFYGEYSQRSGVLRVDGRPTHTKKIA